MKENNEIVKMKVDSFIFYRSFFETLETIGGKSRVKAYDVIVKYALNGEEPTDLSPTVFRVFRMAKSQIDANYNKYLKRMAKEPKVNQKGTIAIFEEEVLLPKKEKPPRKVATDYEISAGSDFEDCEEDDEEI